MKWGHIIFVCERVQFCKQQDVSMPIFGTLPDSKIRILTDYVITLNQFGEMDSKAIRAYSRLTQRLSVQW